MHALVTGGAGFIGSHLVDRLIKDGWDCTSVDNLSTGRSENINQSVQHTFINGDIDFEELRGAVKRSTCIFHLAAVVGVDRVMKLPLQVVMQNIRATSIMLDLAATYQKPILIASSSEVYGRRHDEEQPDLREDMDLHIGPELRWGYAAAKLSDEFAARAYYKTIGLPVIVARLFNTIGPRQLPDHGMVVPRMLDAAWSGRSIPVYGGYQRRAFSWVYDTVDCLVKLMRSPRAYGEIVNVGADVGISMLALARMIRTAVNKERPCTMIDILDSVPGGFGESFTDIMERRPDLTKLRNLIDYRATLSIKEMIEVLVAMRAVAGESGSANV